MLPRWVNDFREVNANTVTDSHPLPCVDDILADCAKGRIWSKLDMMNSFFQTCVHPNDVHLTAVTTPFGLYKWLAMPMGLRNGPAIHQRHVTAALREHIGKICHVYLDDVIIWSSSLEEHSKHIDMVMGALRRARLYCNPKKCKFFQTELDFLGHHISARGIEPNSSKVDKILQWPVPKSCTDVRAFLGLVRYIASFLPKLADYTCILTPLTTKEAWKDFPTWSPEHQSAFEAIKALVVSADCLTTIDHENPGENKIFVTCDASDWRTGATLSFGRTWESAHPMAFDSMQLKGAEKNYPIHEKELLTIIRALKKWRSDLLGSQISVYTDHRTLENFNTQKDLSRRQLRWQEFLSQYEMDIVYIRGEDNTVAIALSRLPPATFPSESDSLDAAPVSPIWTANSVNTVLLITTDSSVLDAIRDGYKTDEFCARAIKSKMPAFSESNGLWYISDRLLIPRVGDIREHLFRMAHDSLGHFSADKSYATLRDAYYWPNMRRNLKQAYIPSCPDCQQNKACTTRKAGPLHPLPVPDAQGDCIAMDFVGPLPVDKGYDCILIITDRLGADIRIVPTRIDISAEDLAIIFFDNWFCENGLPADIVSDRDKLFLSRFWKALHKLTGTRLKMSTAYHPETDGASEWTNKTINQSLHFHVQRNQKGWVRALPRIQFAIMNTVNASTGFSPFQLHLGRSPCLILPIITSNDDASMSSSPDAANIIERLVLDVSEAQDNLCAAKVAQTHFANADCGPEIAYKVEDWVMLSTLHQWNEYKKKGEFRAAKFFPRWDGPYRVTDCHPQASTYTLYVPQSSTDYHVYHASELKPHVANNHSLFPSRKLNKPGPVLTDSGLEEYLIQDIIDSRKRDRGWQFLVRWTGYGAEHDSWLPARELDECTALNVWYQNGGDGPAAGSFSPGFLN